ncbi:hypothetical protein BJ875DRAFT_519771 [Amylocarpus encephaloides]|uniref:Condensation domain-containing protein n=1 Tax=Amylocarpus encephaloides TaxID=45428 RepID=A0A9P7YBV2_9HELO|nr:hypothetical protein BJ875DRAFT_519771 [Amylocarpus encephaloides]
MAQAEVDEITLTEVAEACNLLVSQIQDIYDCTAQQLDQIAERRSEQFQIVLSFGPEADIDRWCEALHQVVSLNSVLRTRFVHCRFGVVQVVTSEEHVTERLSGSIEQYLGDDEEHRLGLGMPLFRSTVVDRNFVATIHHAIMDYWSVSTFLKEDVPLVYLGYPPKKRPPFKEFVTHCMNLDESTSRSFWASRFKGIPAIFPSVNPGYSPHPGGKETRKIALDRINNGVSPIQIPWLTEAAWALTSGTYADSKSVAYGLVLSGRSTALNGIETTLGPTVVEVPIQVNFQRNTTVEQLIKDRAASLRQLQTHVALQYGTPRIREVSEAARTASGYQSILNIVPAMMITLPTSTERSDVVLDRLVWCARGAFSLMMQCNILDDGILLETRYDPAILCERQLSRVLNQFEHTLKSLTEVPLHTKLDKLQRLNPHDRSEIFLWNKTISETAGSHLGTRDASNFNTFAELRPGSYYPEGIPVGCVPWIVTLHNIQELAPVGSIGELLIEGPDLTGTYLCDQAKSPASIVSPPLWASSPERKGTRFYRTRDLAKYNPDGSINFIGRQENRMKFNGQTLQLEELEGELASCAEVKDIVTLVKISGGRTQLVAVVSFNDPQLPSSSLQELSDAYSKIVDLLMNAVHVYARSRLPSHRVPTIWLAVEKLPRNSTGKLCRVDIYNWIKTRRR